MPAAPPKVDALPLDTAGRPKPTQTIRSNGCKFEPRVICLHHKQDVTVENADPMNIDPNVSRANRLQPRTLKSKESHTFQLRPSAAEPNHLSCSCCGPKEAWIWKLPHPWAVVTDADGNFELKHVPILDGGRTLSLWVWHEMLPEFHVKQIGPVELEPGKIGVRDIRIPD